MSKYRVGIAELNKPVSKCNLYFYVVTSNLDDGEKIIYVFVQPDKPFEFDDKGFLNTTQHENDPAYCIQVVYQE